MSLGFVADNLAAFLANHSAYFLANENVKKTTNETSIYGILHVFADVQHNGINTTFVQLSQLRQKNLAGQKLMNHFLIILSCWNSLVATKVKRGWPD